jgi:hypothetical protein
MAGAAGYNGDLTQQRVTIKQLRPAFNLNLKYNSGNFINVRAGIVYTKLVGDDSNNKSISLKNRNLNFKTDVVELNLIAELNLFDPAIYTSYPYLFAGVGVFYFNPYSFNENNKRTYLRPLSTEGEDLPEYPARKKYSLIQPCIPLGVGWKMALSEKWDISYEIGYRFIFTDYLDDVSKTYVDPNVLAYEKGQQAPKMAYRGIVSSQIEGKQRGNPGKNDCYFFSGVKISSNIDDLFHKSKY